MSDDLRNAYKTILKGVGEDIKREGLLETPKRASDAMAYLTSGYNEDLGALINGAVFESSCDEMVLVKNIEFYSLCEHHLLPFTGICTVAYIPNGKVLGLSKVARVVDMFAKRFQIQEHLTQQIAQAVQKTTDAAGVAVTIEGKHFCMMMRGVSKQRSVMSTFSMLGVFKEDAAMRKEFFSALRQK